LGTERRSDRLDELLAEHASWLAVERGLRPNTLAAYRRDLRAYERFVRERRIHDPARIDERVVREYVEDLRARRDEEGNPRYAPASVARALVAVRSFHGFCAEEGAIPDDVAQEVRAPRVPMGIPKALSETQVGALLGAVPGDDARAQRDRAILETLYAAGIRISELVGLDRADVDLDGGLVRVFGKGAKERVAPIGRPARAALDAYLSRGRSELEGSGARRTRAGDAVFLNPRRGRAGGARRARLAPRPASLVRDAPARPRSRHPGRPGAARPRERLDDPDLHEGVARAAAGHVRGRASPGQAGAEAAPGHRRGRERPGVA
jgi:integrase/recombinase XerD